MTADSLAIVHAVRSEKFAGTERYVVTTANALRERGHRVTVIGGDIERMPAELVDVPFHPAATTAAVAGHLARARADIVHVHMTAAEVAAMIVKPLRRYRVVATRHFAQHRGQSRPGRLIAGAVRRSIDREIAISQFVRDTIETEAVLIHNAVPSHEEVARRGRQVLMAQRLSPEKDGATALRAWSASGLGAQGWKLVVAGQGDEAEALRRQAAELGVAASVDFVGAVPDLHRLRADSSAFLATAPAEPFGLSVAESMASGLPVVAAAGGAHLETVGAATPGMVFPAGDAAAAALLLCRLTTDEPHRDEIGRRQRAFATAELGLEKHIDCLEGLYRDVVGSAPSA